MDRQIEFTLKSDQIKILCNHFGVNPEEQEDFELCELLDAHYNARNLTDTTGEGDAADYAGRDRVHLPALSVSSRTGTDHSDTLKPGTEAVQDTCQHKGAYCNPEYRDTGNRCRLGVAADRKQVFAEGGLVPDEPDHDNRGDCP